MKYQLKGEMQDNIIYTIFNNNEIYDIEKFLNPTNENNTDIHKIKNIHKAVELVSNMVENNKNIFLLVDQDVDGYTSSSIMYQYIKSINENINIKYFLHSKKSHGLTKEVMNYLKENHFDLVIIPDAGSNDVEEIKILETEYNTRVLVIDHHAVEKESKYGIIVNNQQDDTNKNLTGAGMAYLVCKALDEKYNTGILENLKDFAMIGLIGDGSNLKENEVRKICIDRINKIENEFIKFLYSEKGKLIDDITFKDLSFGGIIPLINSVVRIGTVEEKKLMFKALNGIDKDYTEIVTKRKLNKEIRKYEMVDFEFNLYQLAIDLGSKLKSRQDKEINKILKEIKKNYTPNDYGIHIHVNSDESIRGINGLLANKIADEVQKPTISCSLVEEEGLYKGSLRGYEKVLSNFKDWCLNTGLFESVEGHDNAAGVSFKVENFEKILEESKNIIGSEKIEKTYYVDNIYQGNANIEDIKLVSKFDKIFKNGLEDPIFAIENITIPKIEGKYTKNTMRFYKDGVTYIKFFTKQEDFNAIFQTGFNSEVNLNLIVKFQVNEWNGRIYPQAEIVDFEIVEEKGKEDVNIYGIFA